MPGCCLATLGHLLNKGVQLHFHTHGHIDSPALLPSYAKPSLINSMPAQHRADLEKVASFKEQTPVLETPARYVGTADAGTATICSSADSEL
eukprot:351762-Chlamydomonas_euryale.AAC.6